MAHRRSDREGVIQRRQPAPAPSRPGGLLPICCTAVDDPGLPISYEALDSGTPVYSSDGERVGSVGHVLSVPEKDVFDGIVIDEREGPGGHRFADADDVDSIHERAVTLKLDAAACRDLPQPSANPAVMADDPADTSSGLSNKLRRAWDLVSGNY
jgi:hypothetical protein